MTSRRIPVSKLVFGALLLLALGGLAWLAVRGWSYYSTPLIERPRHPDYWRLKPGGTWGRWYGIVGTGLMVAMLSYSLRKRVKLFRRLAALPSWLGFHIFCGIVGPLLIVLHTSFKFGGLVAVAFWAMVAVALSGVLGRYLYRQIPRARSGDELSLEEARAQEEELGRRLADLGVSPEVLQQLEAVARSGPSTESSLPMLLLRLPLDGLRLRWQLRAFRRRLGSGSPALRRQALGLARRKARLSRRILLLRRLQQLFHYWHVIHKPFAIVMYLFLALHIAVVTIAGYGWGGG